MVVNIISPGRFHVLDLARELNKEGHDVKFYSFVPRKRAMAFGLPKQCSASLFYPLMPFLLIQRIFGKYQWSHQLRIKVQDILTACVMRKCDLLISMSGDFVYSPQKAKRRGAKIIIERGSKHILEQKRILEQIPSNHGKKPVPDANVKRELKCYEMADYISIATKHVQRSFLKYGFSETKLFVNPYGVDLSMFKPLSQEKRYDVIMVGAWSYQKGCDLIRECIIDLNLKLLHVGTLVDVPFKEDEHFHHHDPVNQPELVNYYNLAKVFILPSRQEGLAMVQAQAIACNLPIIGSKDSGAEDLKQFVDEPKYIIVLQEFCKKSLKHAIVEALEIQKTLGHKQYAGGAIKQLTWEAYGKRYSQFIKSFS